MPPDVHLPDAPVFLLWAMTRDQHSGGDQECTDCRTVAPAGAPFCTACGGKDLRARKQSRFPYDAIAAFLGVIAVIFFWLARS
jgi:ribosomal protein L40E